MYSILSYCCIYNIYRGVVLAKLLYASPAWWGFSTIYDKQRIEAFVHRGVWPGLYGNSDPTVTQLAEDVETKSLFKRIRYSEHHILQQLLPDHNSQSYSL